MNTQITDGFWRERLDVNAQYAIFHQWDQLVASGCIENFRIAAGEVDGFREGWYFADSDAYKWLDAAARICASHPDPRLAALMDSFIALLARAQLPDGYLFTYNQLHFPNTRWTNLQIEHELYCHGHLIEAGVSHFQATGRADLLAIVRRAADRIVADFLGKDPTHTPGHEEIEIALLRLYQVTQHEPYLDMARHFIQQRGRAPLFGFSILKQNSAAEARTELVREKKRAYLAAHPDFKPFQVPPGNVAPKPWNSTLRWHASALTGKYFQQHAPAHKQTIPVGHSVRFAYFETAVAMLARTDNTSRHSGYAQNVSALKQAWERMVTRRMYVTGGIGSLPGLEGFGNDYELDPKYAYAETCAALASMFWNWEMVLLTGEAKYSDLFEWQLYNAAAVGMGADGTSYLYNNPLTCHGGVTRKPWYGVPCCPSNLSRTWADLGKYIHSQSQSELWIHQYVSNQHGTDFAKIEMNSELPWNGKTTMRVTATKAFTLHLRMPSWSEQSQVMVNGKTISLEKERVAGSIPAPQQTASGYDPRESRFLSIQCKEASELIEIDFDMAIQLRRAHPKVKGHRGKVAITRGPLVYCLESIDNPGVDIFNVKVETKSLRPAFDERQLGGIMKIEGRSVDGQPLVFIPYFLWGNRGESAMTVWVNA